MKKKDPEGSKEDRAFSESLISLAKQILEQGRDQTAALKDISRYFQDYVAEITKPHDSPSVHKLYDLLKETFRNLGSAPIYIIPTGMKTGICALDEISAGLQPSSLNVIIGQPGTGKTALCLHMANHVSGSEELPVAYFSFSIPKEQAVLRLLCREAQVEISNARTADFDEGEWGRLSMTAGRLAANQIYIDEHMPTNLSGLCSNIRQMHTQYLLKMVVIDGLPLLPELKAVCFSNLASWRFYRTLKSLASELELPIVLAQDVCAGGENSCLEKAKQDSSVDLALHLTAFGQPSTSTKTTKGIKMTVFKYPHGYAGSVLLQLNASGIGPQTDDSADNDEEV